MRIIQEGHRGVALAPGRGKVPVVYRYQELVLDSGVTIQDVLVGVVEGTDEVVTIPAQSTAKIKQARHAGKEETFSVRIPAELSDILSGVSFELGAHSAKFSSALIRYYLHEAVDSPSLAKRLKRLSGSDIASKRVRTKLTVRSDHSLLKRVRAVEVRENVSRSELVRGAVVAAKEDVFDKPAKRRMAQLRAIAEAV